MFLQCIEKFHKLGTALNTKCVLCLIPPYLAHFMHDNRHALISCNKTLKVRKVFFKTFKELLLLNEIAAENHNVQGNSIKNLIIYNIIRGFKLSKSC